MRNSRFLVLTAVVVVLGGVAVHLISKPDRSVSPQPLIFGPDLPEEAKPIPLATKMSFDSHAPSPRHTLIRRPTGER